MTVEFALRLASAAARVLAPNGGTALVGKDTRLSGYMFEAALEAGFVAAGVDANLIGPLPTPGIAYLTQHFGCRFGVVISASHNLYEDNGIKFFDSAGSKLSDDVEEQIEQLLDEPAIHVIVLYLQPATSASPFGADCISSAADDGAYIDATLYLPVTDSIAVDLSGGPRVQIAPGEAIFMPCNVVHAMPLPRPPVYAVQFLANTFGYSVQGDWHFEPPTFTLSELRALQARVARSLARVRHSVPLAHIPAPRPLFVTGHQEDLDLGLRPHHSARIPSGQDHAALSRK
jgi:hypothetical protein